jgi:hypothetical protein
MESEYATLRVWSGPNPIRIFLTQAEAEREALRKWNSLKPRKTETNSQKSVHPLSAFF